MRQKQEIESEKDEEEFSMVRQQQFVFELARMAVVVVDRQPNTQRQKILFQEV